MYPTISSFVGHNLWHCLYDYSQEKKIQG